MLHKKSYSAPQLIEQGNVVAETLGIGACCCEMGMWKASEQEIS